MIFTLVHAITGPVNENGYNIKTQFFGQQKSALMKTPDA